MLYIDEVTCTTETFFDLEAFHSSLRQKQCCCGYYNKTSPCYKIFVWLTKLWAAVVFSCAWQIYNNKQIVLYSVDVVLFN